MFWQFIKERSRWRRWGCFSALTVGRNRCNRKRKLSDLVPFSQFSKERQSGEQLRQASLLGHREDIITRLPHFR